MKKFTKIAGISAGILAGIGIVCLIISFLLGMRIDKFNHMLHEGKFRFSIGDDIEIDLLDFNDEPEYVKIDEVEVQEIEEGVSNIDLKYDGGKLEICYGNVRDIQLEYQNAATLFLTHDEETLTIEKESVFEDNSDVYLKIILPKNTTYEEMNLEIGVCEAKIDGIVADEINIIVGAGEADISNLETEKVSIEVGAGKANVTNLNARVLDMEVGIGQLDLQVCGTELEYDFNVECGIGSVQIGNHSYSGVGAEYDKHHHSDNHHTSHSMDIECGIGEVRVSFVE